MAKWKKVKLGDVAELIPGFAFKSSDFGSAYKNKSVKIGDIQPPFVNYDSLLGVNIDNYSLSDLQKFKVSKNDYVLAMTGATIGKIGRIIFDEPAYINQRVLKFNPIESVCNKRFLYYIISQNCFNSYVLNFIDSQTAQPNISGTTLNKFEFDLPGIVTQQRIADVLSALDDKIELNNRINGNLEQQAQAIFKEWFVDNAKSEWKKGKLGDFVTIKRGGSPRPIQNYLSETGLRWLKISDVTDLKTPFIFDIAKHIRKEGVHKTVFLQAGSLVLSNSATPGIPKILSVDSCIHDGWLYFTESKFSNEFLYLLFRHARPNFLSKGNGSIFINLKTDIVKKYEFLIPDDDVLFKFQVIIEPLFKEMYQCTAENEKLIEYRNTLLPHLMNGEIEI